MNDIKLVSTTSKRLGDNAQKKKLFLPPAKKRLLPASGYSSPPELAQPCRTSSPSASVPVTGQTH